MTASAQAPEKKQSPIGSCPKTAEIDTVATQKYWFEGALAQKHVRMYLERGGQGVVGVFYNTADWVPEVLGGYWIAGQQETVELRAADEHDVELGHLQGRLTANSLAGVWSPVRPGNEISFNLKLVAQPKCDGSGPWKNFDDKSWAVTLSYPVGWHVSSGAESITLTCPDPSLMAYEGNDIEVTQGAEANEVTSDFIQCGDKWIYGYNCRCADASRCKVAFTEDREGITVVRADRIEWRVYCRGGGYAGLGEGVRRVITFDDKWIVVEGQGPAAALVERVVGAVKKRR
jgi:hypothetical protein